MKRRYKALLAIVIPTALVYILKYTHDASYQWIMGYMVAVSLVFKASILSLWFASKLKLIAFIKGFTLFQGILLLLKRWFLDNVLMQWLKTHIWMHIIEGVEELKIYYIRLNLKSKIKNFLGFIVGIIVFVFFADWIGHLDKLLLLTEVKMIASALFQGVLGFLTKVLSSVLTWLATSWLAPIIEVFALSYLLTLWEKHFGTNNIVSRFFTFIGDKLNQLLYLLGLLKSRHIDPMVQCKVIDNSKKLNSSLKNTHQKQKNKRRI
ncbi:MAG: hypothetical protein Q9M36_02835 [Sulfurovum sp.]|nr:hypothetical protein [Sulfurovum sp.]